MDYVLTDNKALNETSGLFQMPIITRSTIESDGYGPLPLISRNINRAY